MVTGVPVVTYCLQPFLSTKTNKKRLELFDMIQRRTVTPEMGRPKSEYPKTEKVDFRTHKPVREALELLAKQRRWSVSLLCDILLREKLIEELKSQKLPTKEIEELP